MRKVTSVSLGEQLDGFMKRMVEAGRYENASEVMRSALRLLEQQENHQDAVRDAVMKGLNSGISPLSLKEIASQVKKKHNV